jgi:hypothetical protein
VNANPIQEDIGYMDYKLNKKDTFAGLSDKIKIEYKTGMMAGRIVTLRRDIAEELIKHGKAMEIQQ